MPHSIETEKLLISDDKGCIGEILTIMRCYYAIDDTCIFSYDGMM